MSNSEPCSQQNPELVALHHVGAESTALLQRIAAASGCRLYSTAEPGHHVLAGWPDNLVRARTALLGEPALTSVRESVECALRRLDAELPLQATDESRVKLTTVAREMSVPTGTTMLVSREFSFAAAHNLPRYHGKCERLHGHTFKVRITVKAPLDAWSGMAFDFHHLKGPVEERVVKVLDHTYINETIANPSAEFMAAWIWEQLKDLPLHEVTVWETPTCSVTYNGPCKSV